MFWEIMTTVFAWLGAAGIALAAWRFSKQRLPKWTVPAFFGLGMLGFQICSEYDRYPHQASLLPQGVHFVRSVAESVPWWPWSYVVPQTVRFMAVDVENASANRANPELVLADIYLFERRLPAHRIRQVFHCAQRATAVFAARDCGVFRAVEYTLNRRVGRQAMASPGCLMTPC